MDPRKVAEEAFWILRVYGPHAVGILVGNLVLLIGFTWGRRHNARLDAAAINREADALAGETVAKLRGEIRELRHRLQVKAHELALYRRANLFHDRAVAMAREIEEEVAV